MEVVEQILKAPKALGQFPSQRFNPSSRIVLWVLGDRSGTYSLTEKLKSLVYQALGFKFTAGNISLTEISFHVNKFRDAYFEEEYLNVLGGLLQDFKLVCMIQPPFTNLLSRPDLLGAKARKFEIHISLLTHCRYCRQRGSFHARYSRAMPEVA